MIERDMKHKFENLDFQDISKTHGADSIQAWVKMENGYEASIVKHGGSYGSEKGLYEMGIFGPNGSMCDPLGWDDTVLGWLTPQLVESHLQLLAHKRRPAAYSAQENHPQSTWLTTIIM